VELHADSTNAFPFSQLVSSTNGNIVIEGGQPVFSNLTTFTGNSSFLQSNNAGTIASFPALTTLASNSTYFSYIRAYSGSTLSIPLLSKIDTGYVELRSQD